MALIKRDTHCFPFAIVFLFAAPRVIFSACPANFTSTCMALPFNISNPPDVFLNVPDLSVQEISIVVQDLKASVSIYANVANLVSLSAGVDVSIDTVNLTIVGVRAQVQLAVYLDNVATIVTRTMASLDLNPLLTSVVNGVLQTVNNLLGTLTQNGQLIHQIIDSVGNVVNQVLGSAGEVISSVVVGDYQKNMTFTGTTRTLDNGNIIKQYTYPPPAGSSQTKNILVDVLFDPSGKVISATIVNPTTTPTTTANPAITTTRTNATSAVPTTTATVVSPTVPTTTSTISSTVTATTTMVSSTATGTTTTATAAGK